MISKNTLTQVMTLTTEEIEKVVNEFTIWSLGSIIILLANKMISSFGAIIFLFFLLFYSRNTIKSYYNETKRQNNKSGTN